MYVYIDFLSGGLHMEKTRLAPAAVFIWRLRATAAVALCAFLCGAIFVFSPWVACTLGVLCALLYLAVMVFYIPALYRSYFFILYKDSLLLEKGVIFHKRYKLTTDRIQYTEYVQTPMQRLCHIHSVFFHTAGSIVILNQVDEQSVIRLKKLLGDQST